MAKRRKKTKGKSQKKRPKQSDADKVVPVVRKSIAEDDCDSDDSEKTITLQSHQIAELEVDENANKDVLSMVVDMILNPPKITYSFQGNSDTLPPGISKYEYENFVNYIPQSCIGASCWTELQKCKGCEKKLPFNLGLKSGPCGLTGDENPPDVWIFPSEFYFDHCVYKCEGYKSLGLIKKCSDCRSLFLDQNLCNAHKESCYLIAEVNGNRKGLKTILTTERRDEFESKDLFSIEKIMSSKEIVHQPVDMVKDISVMAVPQVHSSHDTEPTMMTCQGCRKSFIRETLELNDKDYMNIKYLNHCIFKCSKYNKQVFCTKCNCFFLNDGHFRHPSIHGCNNNQQENMNNNKSISNKTSKRFREFSENFDDFSDLRCCAQCEIWFVSPKGLGNHFKNFHPVSLMYHCLLCLMTFKREHDMADHFTKKHSKVGQSAN